MLQPMVALSTLSFATLLLLGAAQQQPAAVPAQAAAPAAGPAAIPAAGPAAVVIPAEAVRMVNPVRPTAEGLAQARKMYGYDCAMCHGVNGDGKGEVVASMNLTLKDWTDPAALKGTTDGELFYIIKNGQGQMTGEDGRAKPAEMWEMVVMVRGFAKK